MTSHHKKGENINILSPDLHHLFIVSLHRRLKFFEDRLAVYNIVSSSNASLVA